MAMIEKNFPAGQDAKKTSSNKILKNIKKYFPFYVIFTPVMIYLVIFQFLPMAGVIIAFKNYQFLKGFWGSDWVGLDHFIRFFKNGDFSMIMSNTVILSIMRLIFGFPAPIIFALMLNELRSVRLKKLIQTVTYLPHFISWVIVYGIVFDILSANGLVNSLIRLFGGETVTFLGRGEYFRQILVVSAIWKELGWSAIIYLAALAGVDTQLYEACMIDGGNRRQRMWYVTLPSIRNVISIMFILNVGHILNAGFEQVLVMLVPQVRNVGEIVDYYIYRQGLTLVNNYSYAAAVGLFKSVLSLFLVLGTNLIAKRIDEESAIW